MKTGLLTNATKWDNTPPPMYKNEDVISYEYSKNHDNTHMGAIENISHRFSRVSI